ncbi:MAG: PilZ domain-containing protein [Deltaproteobacteria bacterium]|nr:PilZ domain-containing protein [Deltaproteobacteria bacterium]
MTDAERPTSSPSDKRRFPRFDVTAYVDYTGSEVLLYHRIENISLGGICIQTASIEDVGTVVDLVINFPDLGTTVAVRGEVVWANREPPSDMGIRYVDMDDERREVLRRYITAVRR